MEGTTCYSCGIFIDCPCTNEQYIRYRTCTERSEFPRSTQSAHIRDGNLEPFTIHLCSHRCEIHYHRAPIMVICNYTACDKNNVSMRCGKCKTAFYCNRECQKADWINHKQVCHDKPFIS